MQREAVTTVVMCLPMLVLSSCAHEVASRDEMLSSQSARSAEQTAALRNRLNGQAQR